jgi:hypothetical protein
VPPPAPAFGPSDPVSEVVESDRPLFRWRALPRAASYVVRVYDPMFNLIATSPALESTEWQASTPLDRDRVYSWQIAARLGGAEVRAPAPPAPEAKFKVLDASKASELADARGRYPDSHLLLASLYAEAGVLNAAERELDALEQANPGSAAVRALHDALRRQKASATTTKPAQ